MKYPPIALNAIRNTNPRVARDSDVIRALCHARDIKLIAAIPDSDVGQRSALNECRIKLGVA